MLSLRLFELIKENLMPNMTIPFVSMESSVLVEIYNDISRDVAEIIGVGPDTFRVLYNSMEVSKTDIRSNAKYGPEDNTPTTNAKSRLTVEVTDDYDEEMIGSEIVNRRDHFPIFRDTDIEVSIAPVYTTNNIQFQFTYISTSKIEIENIRDRLRMLLSRTISLFEHTVEYSMIIPDSVIEFIKDVHELKSRLYPISFIDYMTANASNRIHLLTDMSNAENAMYAVKERVHRINGSFDFETNPPERETDRSRNVHRLRFSYNIQLEVPKALTIHYPIMVCNRLMKDEYLLPILKREEMIQSRREQPMRYLGRSATIMHNLATSRIQPISYDSPYPIRIPKYDQFVDYQTLPGYGVLLTLLIAVDESDRRTLFNLKELGDYFIKPKALKYIEENKRAVTSHYSGLLFFGLEQSGRHMCSERLIIDDDLNVKSDVELELIRPVRVTLSVCLDLNYLPDPVRKELIEDNDLFITFLREYVELGPWLLTNIGADAQARDRILSEYIIRKVYDLYRLRELEVARTICAIIGSSTRLAMIVGRLFVMSFPDILSNLVRKGVCYIEHGGALQAMSTIPEIAVRQVAEHNHRAGRTKGGYTGLRPIAYEITLDNDGNVGYTQNDYRTEPIGPRVPYKPDHGQIGRDKNREDNGLDKHTNDQLDGNYSDIGKVNPPTFPIREHAGFDYGIMKTVENYGILALRRD